jgi:hypothetical protein
MYSSGQRVVWWRGPTRGRLTAVHCLVTYSKADKIQVSLNDGGKRWVPVSRVQPIQKWYTSSILPDYLMVNPSTNQWGRCTIFTEIGEDLFATRCVYQFEDQHWLRYDRSHWIDELGQLGTLAFCRFRWSEIWEDAKITATDFEQAWNEAKKSDDFALQLAHLPPGEFNNIRPWTRTPVSI